MKPIMNEPVWRRKLRHMISMVRHPVYWFNYYVGRNSLGPPYYGIWCIRNFFWNIGFTPKMNDLYKNTIRDIENYVD